MLAEEERKKQVSVGKSFEQWSRRWQCLSHSLLLHWTLNIFTWNPLKMIIGRAVTSRSLWLRRWISVSTAELNGKRFAALWGNGDHGRLGHGAFDSRWRPNALPPSAFDNQSLRQIACGGAHSLFLTGSNNIQLSDFTHYLAIILKCFPLFSYIRLLWMVIDTIYNFGLTYFISKNKPEKWKQSNKL